MRRAAVVAIALLTIVPSATAAQPLSARVGAAAARAGFSGEVAAVRRGRLVYAQGFGYADRQTRTRPTLDTAFNLASIGKTFTGVAVAQLVQAGRLSFADRLGRFGICRRASDGSRSGSFSTTRPGSATSSRTPASKDGGAR